MRQDVRLEIAHEAARLMCEQGMRDYGQAKHKAMLALASPRGPAPTNLEIADSVLEYLRLFDHEAWQERLERLRETACQAMRLLERFQPRLVGAAVDQRATSRSPVQLHLFSDFDEAVDLFLAEQNIPFDDIERRFRHPDGRELHLPGCAFVAGEVEVELIVFGADDLRWSPLSPVDGRPMQRWDVAELEQAMAGASQP